MSPGKQAHLIFSKSLDHWENVNLNLSEEEIENKYKLCGVKSDKETKLLGFILTEDYCWDKHLAGVVSRMAARLPHIKRIRYCVKKPVLIRISIGWVMSIFYHGVELTSWKPSDQRSRSIESMNAEVKLLNCKNIYKYFAIMSLQRILERQTSSFNWDAVDLEINKVRVTRFKSLTVGWWRPRLAIGQNSYIIRASSEMNALQLYLGEWARSEDRKEELKALLILRYGNANLK